MSNVYSAQDVYDVMSKLVSAYDKTVPFGEIYKTLGRDKVEALISDGILFYHPGSEIGKSPESATEVLMPTSVPALRAMEILSPWYSHLQRNSFRHKIANFWNRLRRLVFRLKI